MSGRGLRIMRSMIVALVAGLSATQAVAQVAQAPAAFGVADRAAVLVVHAVGAQIYECKADPAGRAGWAFREPIASLISEGRSIGRHYLGPTWELADGSAVKGALAQTAPGATAADVPLLKLEVVEHRGAGVLTNARLVLRLNTRGGVLSGPCASVGELRAEPYSADYVFLR